MLGCPGASFLVFNAKTLYTRLLTRAGMWYNYLLPFPAHAMGKMRESVGKMLKMLIKMLKKFRVFSIFETPLFSTAPAHKMGQDKVYPVSRTK